MILLLVALIFMPKNYEISLLALTESNWLREENSDVKYFSGARNLVEHLLFRLSKHYLWENKCGCQVAKQSNVKIEPH